MSCGEAGLASPVAKPKKSTFYFSISVFRPMVDIYAVYTVVYFILHFLYVVWWTWTFGLSFPCEKTWRKPLLIFPFLLSANGGYLCYIVLCVIFPFDFSLLLVCPVVKLRFSFPVESLKKATFYFSISAISPIVDIYAIYPVMWLFSFLHLFLTYMSYGWSLDA